ncbi:signal transduction histidine kinase [Herbihabitans rhizosphaerae]|uniref:histidine kinase n=1 Tax=Herbihabitans rhizosphaerae TaxID=1872711 RepID=A0A4Q7KE75_9PSEU|nr:histidine kinase [Herbihabitans rhizosphaerae]RZS29490.1 signal transduction histidine kinase [Herbihabitans rhizosphaerae]
MTTATAQRWLAALLAGAFVLDALYATDRGPRGLPALLVGIAAIACAYFGVRRAAIATFAAAGTLLLSSFWLRLTDMYAMSVGRTGFMLSELLACSVLVVLVVWRARPAVAAGATTTLVLCAAAGLGIRMGLWRIAPERWLSPLARPAVLGLFLLAGAVALGIALRRAGERGTDADLTELLRRQWPLAGALGILLLADIDGWGGRLLFGTSSLRGIEWITVGVSALVGACAVLAARRPMRPALVAAGLLVVFAVPIAVHDLTSGGGADPTLPMTQVAASMALVAFLYRQVDIRIASWCTAALVTGNAATVLAAISSDYHWLQAEVILPLGFLVVASILAGLYFRSRDRELDQMVRSSVADAQHAERLSLARDMHDVVAHQVTAIVVQAQAAKLAAERDPSAAITALDKIEASGADALAAMRKLVGGMRDARPSGNEEATTDLDYDIRSTVDRFEGPFVHLELSLPDDLPGDVGRSILRLVQESLTNVSKHARGATVVRVVVDHADGQVRIEVTDDGDAAPASGDGYGLIGMRERAELLGGTFEAGPAEHGWQVLARIPYRNGES